MLSDVCSTIFLSCFLPLLGGDILVGCGMRMRPQRRCLAGSGVRQLQIRNGCEARPVAQAVGSQ